MNVRVDFFRSSETLDHFTCNQLFLERHTMSLPVQPRAQRSCACFMQDMQQCIRCRFYKPISLRSFSPSFVSYLIRRHDNVIPSIINVFQSKNRHSHIFGFRKFSGKLCPSPASLRWRRPKLQCVLRSNCRGIAIKRFRNLRVLRDGTCRHSIWWHDY